MDNYSSCFFNSYKLINTFSDKLLNPILQCGDRQVNLMSLSSKLISTMELFQGDKSLHVDMYLFYLSQGKQGSSFVTGGRGQIQKFQKEGAENCLVRAQHCFFPCATTHEHPWDD